MASINRIGRALVFVSALSVPALALAEAPATTPKPAVTKKEDANAHRKHDAMHHDANGKAHKADGAKSKTK